MKVPILTFFNNKGGVGKTSLVYHLAWMFSDMGKHVLAVDLDPQMNLTAAFFEEDTIADFLEGNQVSTIYQAIAPLADVGDILTPDIQNINNYLTIIPGDMALSEFESNLSEAWPKLLDDGNINRYRRIIVSFWHVIQMAISQMDTAPDIVLVDVGPNLGAINRSALIATDYVITPLGADLFSLQGLKNLGPTLRRWRAAWKKRLDHWNEQDPDDGFRPTGSMQPIGYLCQQPGIRLDRPVKAYDKWMNRMPNEYRQYVLGEEKKTRKLPDKDPMCLAVIKHYRSLVPLSQEARKPIFHLTSADGASGAHQTAASKAHGDFQQLAEKVWNKIH
ncbi:MAG: ParA family protein [Planctomycetaceae bacterium]|nr:ParA family protein [Planctomycetaceae bacterium]